MGLGSCVPPLLSLPQISDISNCKCVRAFTFINLDSCVLTLNYW